MIRSCSFFPSGLVGWLLAASALLAACQEQPAGEAIVRAEIGKNGTRLIESPQQPAAAQTAAVQPDTPAAPGSPCREARFGEVPIIHCVIDPARHRIALMFRQDGGKTPVRLAEIARGKAGAPTGPILLAVKGTSVDENGRARGYLVQDSTRISLLDRGRGDGNFYMKPNGVLFGSGSKWAILTTERFFAEAGDRPQFGMQSGPMLVIEGKLHPDFQDDGPSRTIRSGVGIDDQGRLHYALARAPVSFGLFARFFRDEARTPNALLLSGQGSALWDPLADRLIDSSVPAPILLVTQREDTP